MVSYLTTWAVVFTPVECEESFQGGSPAVHLRSTAHNREVDVAFQTRSAAILPDWVCVVDCFRLSSECFVAHTGTVRRLYSSGDCTRRKKIAAGGCETARPLAQSFSLDVSAAPLQCHYAYLFFLASMSDHHEHKCQRNS